MRSLCFIFFFAAINICKAQDIEISSVRIFKESPKIDSLMSSILKNPITLKASGNDSCFLLNLHKADIDAGFIQGIQALGHKKVMFVDLLNKKGLGCFEFRGYWIFVYGDSFMNEFFTTTEFSREAIFIKPNVKDTIYNLRNYSGWVIFYRDGDFGYGMH